LLARKDDNVLRYAALEFRRCIEAIIYEKLLFYRDLLPERSVRSWQPDKAFEALIKFDDDAEDTMNLRWARKLIQVNCPRVNLQKSGRTFDPRESG
jgi:hypothetical protein